LICSATHTHTHTPSTWGHVLCNFPWTKHSRKFLWTKKTCGNCDLWLPIHDTLENRCRSATSSQRL